MGTFLCMLVMTDIEKLMIPSNRAVVFQVSEQRKELYNWCYSSLFPHQKGYSRFAIGTETAQ